MAPLDWLRHLLDLTLTPLLQWLLRYGVGFCPHGQNLILVIDADPAPVLIKDFAQGVDLLNEQLESYESLPPEMPCGPPHVLVGALSPQSPAEKSTVMPSSAAIWNSRS